MSALILGESLVDDDGPVSVENEIVGDGPAARHARALAPVLAPVLGVDGAAIVGRIKLADAPDSAADWARSGGRALTGYAHAGPMGVTGHPAPATRGALAWLTAISGAIGLPGVELLGERAALTGLERNAPWSCGGAMRLLPCRDGHLAVSLARPTDADLVPAIVESTGTGDVWAALETWAEHRLAVELARRCQLLGVPAAPVTQHPDASRPWLVATRGGTSRPRIKPPVIVDLTALWAGPLCARLLRQCGGSVTKVESTRRPDGARAGSPAFFEHLNQGSEHVALDFDSSRGRAELAELIESADVVLEASRPRALRHLGIRAEDAVATGTIWLSITARGRGSDWVGFGDDIAAGAGLLADADEALPAGDALADPLAGVHGAVAVAAALRSDSGWLLDLSMHDTARLCADERGTA
ncbi:hypothetical protein JNB_10669 [Janibacter sp. HTCC2649]|uniref:CoA transferase n=1 Tax=Janibacter sp. HTCC2649 TaxID=313589 RepID=UPI0000670B0E|nr:CoA transferase [Janibacter sp. HTCC2649]EAQ00631.1 hypothetical protein JNB_10669 [Janibacter sp. HTCC2649]